MATAPNTPDPAPAEDVYAIFCGAIDQPNAQRIVNSLTGAMSIKVKHIHVLFQSNGGYIADGIFLFNLFRTLPIELTLYNVGQLSSAAVIAYLGAGRRKTAANATFMVHRSTYSPQFATSSKLHKLAKNLILDDERCEAIVRERVTLPEDLWSEIQHHDVYLSGDEAVKFGMADEIGEFAPPAGTQVYNMLAG